MNTEDRLQLMALRNDVAELEKRRIKIAEDIKELAQQHLELMSIINQLKVRISELEKR